ncbi:transposable element Tcb2 transposase [Trichonephila clavipes]|nr:transposable element Tcb2 transposase [Trichonephila clavipes]
MLNGRTELQIFDKWSVIGDLYCEEVLLLHARLFRGVIGTAFIFMDDNARPHRTLAVEELLESEDITRMDCTSTSSGGDPTTQTDAHLRMGTPTTRNVAPAGSEYAETVLSNHCNAATIVGVQVPTIRSLMVWKMCEALNLKAKYVPLPGAASLVGRHFRRTKRDTIIPVVRSFHVWKMCQALDIPATYDPQHSRSTFTLKQNKTIPVVHSIAVFKMCNALNLRAEFNSDDCIVEKTFLLQVRRENLSSPLYNSTFNYSTCYCVEEKFSSRLVGAIRHVLTLPTRQKRQEKKLSSPLGEQFDIRLLYLEQRRGKTFFPISGSNSTYAYSAYKCRETIFFLISGPIRPLLVTASRKNVIPDLREQYGQFITVARKKFLPH